MSDNILQDSIEWAEPIEVPVLNCPNTPVAILTFRDPESGGVGLYIDGTADTELTVPEARAIVAALEQGIAALGAMK